MHTPTPTAPPRIHLRVQPDILTSIVLKSGETHHVKPRTAWLMNTDTDPWLSFVNRDTNQHHVHPTWLIKSAVHAGDDDEPLGFA